jgi:hypothetical protein
MSTNFSFVLIHVVRCAMLEKKTRFVSGGPLFGDALTLCPTPNEAVGGGGKADRCFLTTICDVFFLLTPDLTLAGWVNDTSSDVSSSGSYSSSAQANGVTTGRRPGCSSSAHNTVSNRLDVNQWVSTFFMSHFSGIHVDVHVVPLADLPSCVLLPLHLDIVWCIVGLSPSNLHKGLYAIGTDAGIAQSAQPVPRPLVEI